MDEVYNIKVELFHILWISFGIGYLRVSEYRA